MRNLTKLQIHRFLLVIVSTLFINANLFSATKLNESFTPPSFMPAGWTKVHVAGALNAGDWGRSTSNFKTAPACILSAGGILADNWLITPQIPISTGDSLVYYISSNYLLSANGRLEIKYSTTNNAVGSFNDFLIPVHIDLEALTPNVYYRRAVSLNQVAGQNVYIAFRHIEVVG
ncbi:MAG: choice-of-anchor J domain-containing protein, partial [Ignavibacteria bacterium]